MAKKSKSKKYSKSQTLKVSIVSFILGAIIGLAGSVGYSLVDVKSDDSQQNVTNVTVVNEIKETKPEQKSEEELQKEIANILDHKYEPTPVQQTAVPVSEPVVEKNDSFVQQPTYEEIEKPKVNVDIDSVVVNNKPAADEDFFDDFFGTEDE